MLSHLIRGEDYLEAAVLAFKLGKVRDFYHILNKLTTRVDHSQDQIDSIITDFNQFNTLQESQFVKP